MTAWDLLCEIDAATEKEFVCINDYVVVCQYRLPGTERVKFLWYSRTDPNEGNVVPLKSLAPPEAVKEIMKKVVLPDIRKRLGPIAAAGLWEGLTDGE